MTQGHPGNIERKHRLASVFSTGGKWAVGGIAVFTAGLATNVIGKGLTYAGYDGCGSYPCCGGNLNSEGCFEYYSCCNQAVGRTRGCCARNRRDQYYPCCNDGAGSSGCEERYSCCHGAIGSEGCVEKCNKCKQGITDNTQKCGFEMKCCGFRGSVADRDDARDGCKTRCKQCHKIWGKPLSPNDEYWSRHGHTEPNREQGCIYDVKHVMKRID